MIWLVLKLKCLGWWYFSEKKYCKVNKFHCRIEEDKILVFQSTKMKRAGTVIGIIVSVAEYWFWLCYIRILAFHKLKWSGMESSKVWSRRGGGGGERRRWVGNWEESRHCITCPACPPPPCHHHQHHHHVTTTLRSFAFFPGGLAWLLVLACPHTLAWVQSRKL